MAVSQNERLEAVLSKLESIEIELRQCKRILQFYGINATTPEVQRRVEPSDPRQDNGLYPGQIPYQPGEDPNEIAKTAKIIKEEEIGTCAT